MLRVSGAPELQKSTGVGTGSGASCTRRTLVSSSLVCIFLHTTASRCLSSRLQRRIGHSVAVQVDELLQHMYGQAQGSKHTSGLAEYPVARAAAAPAADGRLNGSAQAASAPAPALAPAAAAPRAAPPAAGSNAVSAAAPGSGAAGARSVAAGTAAAAAAAQQAKKRTRTGAPKGRPPAAQPAGTVASHLQPLMP